MRYVIIAPVLMAVVFTALAMAGIVTSDPAGLHPVTVAQMWGLR